MYIIVYKYDSKEALRKLNKRTKEESAFKKVVFFISLKRCGPNKTFLGHKRTNKTFAFTESAI